VVITPVNAHDKHATLQLLHSNERGVCRLCPHLPEVISQQQVGQAGTRKKQQEVECVRQGLTYLSVHQAPLRLCQGQLSRHDEERQSPARRGGAGESVHSATPSVATSAGEVRLMNGKSTGMVGEMTPDGVISGQFEYPQLNVGAPFSLVVTCSDLV